MRVRVIRSVVSPSIPAQLFKNCGHMHTTSGLGIGRHLPRLKSEKYGILSEAIDLELDEQDNALGDG